MDTQPRLLPLNAMARWLRVPLRWLRAEAGRIPCLRAVNQFLFDPAAVEAALLERARLCPTDELRPAARQAVAG